MKLFEAITWLRYQNHNVHILIIDFSLNEFTNLTKKNCPSVKKQLSVEVFQKPWKEIDESTFCHRACKHVQAQRVRARSQTSSSCCSAAPWPLPRVALTDHQLYNSQSASGLLVSYQFLQFSDDMCIYIYMSWLWLKMHPMVEQLNIKEYWICGLTLLSNHIPQLNCLVLFYPAHRHIFICIYIYIYCCFPVLCVCETLTLCPVAIIPKIVFFVPGRQFRGHLHLLSSHIPGWCWLTKSLHTWGVSTDKHFTKLSALVVCCFQIYNHWTQKDSKFEMCRLNLNSGNHVSLTDSALLIA